MVSKPSSHTWFSSDHLLPGATEGDLANGCRRLRQICDPPRTLIDLAKIHTGREEKGGRRERKEGREEEALVGRWSFGEGREQQLFFARSTIKLLPALLIALAMFYSLLPPQINVRQ